MSYAKHTLIKKGDEKMEDNGTLNALRDAITAKSSAKRGAALIQMYKAIYGNFPMPIRAYTERKVGDSISTVDCLMYFEEVITADNKDDVKGSLGELIERISECF